MILHVTNGDSAGGTLKLIFREDRVLSWRAVVHDVPKREDWTAEEAMLRGPWAEVVLWFEHDLFDQVQVLELLDLLKGRHDVTLIQPNEYLGPMDQATLGSLFPTRRPVTGERYREAGRAWAAFRAPVPHGLTEFAIFDRLCEEYPAVEDGCTRTERFILRTLAAGYRNRRALFAEFGASEDPVWMGDLPFFDVLAGLQRGPQPLVNGQNQVTAKGRAVLEGREDRILGNGIDRWIGGVHLAGADSPWRWNRALKRFEAGKTS